jgi:ElaB/YqjD/DUF883 family membrane-anchored ribosome-binding protein
MAQKDTATIGNELEALQADFAALKEDFTSLARTASRKGAEALNGQKEALNGIAHSAIERGRSGVAAVEKQIVARPIASLVVAFGAGILLAKIMDR